MVKKHSPHDINAVFVAAIVALSSLSINIVVPLTLNMENSLGPIQGGVTQVVGAFTAGYAFGQLIVVIFVDGFDKKKATYIALLLFAIASLGAAVSSDWMTHLVFRFIQGVCASFGGVIGRALVMSARDYETSAQKLSGASAIFTWAPVIAPILGAFLADQFGWRFVFYSLGIYSVAAAFAVFRAPALWFQTGKLKSNSKNRLATLISDGKFLVSLVIGASIFAGVFAYFTVADRLSDEIGFGGMPIQIVAASMSGAYAIGTLFSTFLFSRLTSMQILLNSSVAIAFLSAMSVLSIYILDGRYFFILAIVHAVAAGMAFPNSNMLAMKNVPSSASVATGIFGFAKMAAASFVAYLAAFTKLPASSFFVLVMLVCSIITLAGVLALSAEREP